jgi:hypothetical protein
MFVDSVRNVMKIRTFLGIEAGKANRRELGDRGVPARWIVKRPKKSKTWSAHPTD